MTMKSPSSIGRQASLARGEVDSRLLIISDISFNSFVTCSVDFTRLLESNYLTSLVHFSRYCLMLLLRHYCWSDSYT